MKITIGKYLDFRLTLRGIIINIMQNSNVFLEIKHFHYKINSGLVEENHAFSVCSNNTLEYSIAESLQNSLYKTKQCLNIYL